MKHTILLIVFKLIIFSVMGQRLEFSGNFLTPGYTINTGLGFTLKKQINISFGASYLINNSIKFRGSTINYLTAYNERFVDRLRGCYMRFEESIINKPKYQLNLMQFLNFQQSDRARIAAVPYGVIGDDQLYLYERKQENNLYYLEYYLGLSLITELSPRLQLRTSLGAGISRSPFYISPQFKQTISEFSQHGGLSLIYNFKGN